MLVGVNWQEPEPLTNVTVQLAPVVSLTETVPVGTPLTAGETVTEAVTAAPNRAGLGDAVTVVVVFSVKITLSAWLAFCAGGPGSATETLKLYEPGTAVWPAGTESVPDTGSRLRNAGRPLADHV